MELNFFGMAQLTCAVLPVGLAGSRAYCTSKFAAKEGLTTLFPFPWWILWIESKLCRKEGLSAQSLPICGILSAQLAQLSLEKLRR